MHISDDLFLGPVNTEQGDNSTLGNPSPMPNGVGPMGRVFVWDTVPLALNLTGLATAQAVAGAANLALTAGTGVTKTTDASGAFRYVLDVPRCVDVVSAGAGDTTQTVTFSGYDAYGQAMSQAVALNGVTRVATKKAFKSITNIAVSAATAGNISSGTTDVLGCPIRLLSKDYLTFNFNATVGLLAAVTVADATSPATTATGDVRGTVALASASDGTKRLVAMIATPAIAVGPNATRIGALGVTQV